MIILLTLLLPIAAMAAVALLRWIGVVRWPMPFALYVSGCFAFGLGALVVSAAMPGFPLSTLLFTPHAWILPAMGVAALLRRQRSPDYRPRLWLFALVALAGEAWLLAWALGLIASD